MSENARATRSRSGMPQAASFDGVSAASAKGSLICLVGGAYDESGGPVKTYFPRFRAAHPAVEVNYYSHMAEDDIFADAQEKCPVPNRLILIGHSWGGDTAADVVIALAESGRQADLLVTADPVSTGYFTNKTAFLSNEATPRERARAIEETQLSKFRFMARVRKSVHLWANIYAEPKDDRNSSDRIADAGGQWGDEPEEFAHYHRRVDLHHAQFAAMLTEDIGGKTALGLVRQTLKGGLGRHGSQ